MLRLLCAACVCLPVISYPSMRGDKEQLVPAGSQMIICKRREMQVAGFAVLTEGKS